tara:strand:- start:370 stop:516 length:147 start_codon:yes stop_codon:yes gene_type:complete
MTLVRFYLPFVRDDKHIEGVYDNGDVVGISWWIGHFHGTLIVIRVMND